MKRLSIHLQYHWWQYLVFTLVVIFFWSTIFQILAQPASHEAIRILFVGEYWDTQNLEDEIFSYLQQDDTQPISSVEIDIDAQKTDQLLPILIAKQYHYDLVIVSESRMQDSIGQNAFGLPIPDQITDAHPQWHYYTEQYDQTAYSFGIMLCGNGICNTFSANYTGLECCYLFISNQSVNLDQLNGQGQPGYDAAIETIEYLLLERS